MLRVKRLDIFMLRHFLPLFAMTFLICTFIVLLQFLWLHLQDLVGKGISPAVLGELFFYAALSMVPMALPLAVLLASLMTFGNLGESLELTALKAGGISLFRVMRPLIVLMVFVAVGAFFFQNNILPLAQTKMWTILKSVRQKTPELDIAEGEFNYQLPNINIYVQSKNRQTGVLYDVMIYDMRQGFERSRVIMADSATLRTAPDKTHMYLNLFSGELFENMREGSGSVTTAARNFLYRRELFDHKMISVAFDMNLEMIDEGDVRATYAGKNVRQLSHTIDSMSHRIDSIGFSTGREIASKELMGVKYDSVPEPERRADAVARMVFDPDSMRRAMGTSSRRSYILHARTSLQGKQLQYFNRATIMADQQKTLRRTGIELHRRFTLSLACLVFFFVGAPLGAIIRKGGLGTPLIISVLLFIFYYIIDNTGFRLARDGKVPVWVGTWLSSGVLLPLGIFVTYKAVRDSAVFNADSYARLWRTLTGKNVRHLAVKEVVIEDFDPARAAEMLAALATECNAFAARHPRPCGYGSYWRGSIPSTEVTALNASVEHTVSYLSNTRSQKLLDLTASLPILENFRILHPAPGRWSTVCHLVLPLGLTVWLLSLPWQRRLLLRVNKISKSIPEIITVLQHEQH